MKTKSLFKKALACMLIIAMNLTISTAALATVNDSRFADILDLTEAMQEIGLSVDVDILSQHSNRASINIDYMPHIGRVSQDTPILISSESDVDLLLTFAKLLTENQVAGFSLDTCIEEAIAEAGLEDYWRTGFRTATRNAREQEILDLATSHTWDELREMGFFDRAGMADEVRALGLFDSSAIVDAYEVESATVQSRGSFFGSVPLMTLQPTSIQWRSNFLLQPGDTVFYTVSYLLSAGTTVTSFATGTATANTQGVDNAAQYTVWVNTATSSRQFYVTTGGKFFSILPTGREAFTISGSYQVWW